MTKTHILHMLCLVPALLKQMGEGGRELSIYDPAHDEEG